MSDLKFFAFVIFLFIIFGAFMAVFESSQIQYLKTAGTADDGLSGMAIITGMTAFDTHSQYGRMFMGGIALLVTIAVIIFLRG